ncbi:MAG: MBL fold metallo-hydrolase [candidate division WOR-3 bacterium]
MPVSSYVMATGPSGDCVVFLGSGGARVVVAKQVRASGGIWFSLAGTEFLVDPGPGALVRMTGSQHRLDPVRLAGILLSHRHLDHAGDVNNMIEAMTVGGTRPHGTLFAPADALEGDDPVVLRYLRTFLDGVVTVQEGGEYVLGSIRFTCPIRHRHRGETYGFRFRAPGLVVSYIADTAYFPALVDAYRADIVIMNVVRLKPSKLDHLHAPEALELIRQMRPKLAIITHFGMTMIRGRPWHVAREMSEQSGVTVVAASDGRKIDLVQYSDRTGEVGQSEIAGAVVPECTGPELGSGNT